MVLDRQEYVQGESSASSSAKAGGTGPGSAADDSLAVAVVSLPAASAGPSPQRPARSSREAPLKLQLPTRRVQLEAEELLGDVTEVTAQLAPAHGLARPFGVFVGNRGFSGTALWQRQPAEEQQRHSRALMATATQAPPPPIPRFQMPDGDAGESPPPSGDGASSRRVRSISPPHGVTPRSARAWPAPLLSHRSQHSPRPRPHPQNDDNGVDEHRNGRQRSQQLQRDFSSPSVHDAMVPRSPRRKLDSSRERRLLDAPPPPLLQPLAGPPLWAHHLPAGSFLGHAHHPDIRVQGPLRLADNSQRYGEQRYGEQWGVITLALMSRQAYRT